MNVRVGAAAAVLVVFAAGCVGTGEAVTPTSTTEPTPVTTVSPTGTTPPPTAPEEPIGSTTTIAEDPWPGVHPDFDFEQNGLIAPQWDSEAYGTDEFALDLEELAATGAEWVTLIPTWYQADVTTSEIQPEWQGRTATDAALSAAIERSRDLALKVALKPHVDLSEGGPRAAIEPADTDAWFSSYTDFITHYAELAEEADADEFIVGTELAGTDRSDVTVASGDRRSPLRVLRPSPLRGELGRVPARASSGTPWTRSASTPTSRLPICQPPMCRP